MADLLIVSEAPSTDGPGLPLDEGSSGRRMRDILGRPPHDVARVVNLFDHPVKRWSAPAARSRAAELALETDQWLILCGRRVAAAFDMSKAPWLTWCDWCDYRAAVFPHPSGRNRWWNDPGRARQAETFLRYATEAA